MRSVSTLVFPSDSVVLENGTRCTSLEGRLARRIPSMIVSVIQASRSCGVIPAMPSPKVNPNPVKSGYSSNTWVTHSRV